VPSNYVDICNNASYLYTLYIAFLESLDYSTIILDVDYTPKMTSDDKKDRYLKSFGIPLVSGRFEECPSRKGYLRDGFFSLLKHMFTKKGTAPLNLFKFEDAHSIHSFIFDEKVKIWSVEKKLVDNMIHLARDIEFDMTNIRYYMKPYNMILKELGLSRSVHDTDALSQDEKDFVSAYLDECKSLLTEEIYNEIDSTVRLDQFVKNLKEEQKMLKPYRDLLKDIVSARIGKVYSQFKTKSEKKFAKSMSLAQLIEQVDETSILPVFNPTRLFKLIKLPVVGCVYTNVSAVRVFLATCESGLESSLEKGAISDSLYSSAMSMTNGYAEWCSSIIENN
jgi:hypothetical protein